VQNRNIGWEVQEIEEIKTAEIKHDQIQQ